LKRQKDPEADGKELNWREFEEFVESAFISLGFQTRRNARFRKPAAEIDLVAKRNGLVFAVDCKHWKRTVGNAAMSSVGERQIIRARRLAEENGVQMVIPVIVTLHDERLQVLENGVPIVPVYKISDFVLNWENARGEILILTSTEHQERLG
jgi:Holliday junction resolvase-like predicted endonuclease